jgi:hypothetical protein
VLNITFSGLFLKGMHLNSPRLASKSGQDVKGKGRAWDEILEKKGGAFGPARVLRFRCHSRKRCGISVEISRQTRIELVEHCLERLLRAHQPDESVQHSLRHTSRQWNRELLDSPSVQIEMEPVEDDAVSLLPLSGGPSPQRKE